MPPPSGTQSRSSSPYPALPFHPERMGIGDYATHHCGPVTALAIYDKYGTPTHRRTYPPPRQRPTLHMMIAWCRRTVTTAAMHHNHDPPPHGHRGVPACLPVGCRYLVSGAGDGFVKVWSLQTRTCVRTMHGHHGSVLSLIAGTTTSMQVVDQGMRRGLTMAACLYLCVGVVVVSGRHDHHGLQGRHRQGQQAPRQHHSTPTHPPTAEDHTVSASLITESRALWWCVCCGGCRCGTWTASRASAPSAPTTTTCSRSPWAAPSSSGSTTDHPPRPRRRRGEGRTGRRGRHAQLPFYP